jgi:hypothetical protein
MLKRIAVYLHVTILSLKLLESLDKIISAFNRKILRLVMIGNAKVEMLFLGELYSEVEFEALEPYSAAGIAKSVNFRYPVNEFHAFNNRWLVEIQNPKCDTKTGLMLSKHGRLISESTSWPLDRILNSSPTIPRVSKVKNIDFNSRLLILPANGFYHWLLEDLPLFLFAHKRYPDSLVCYYESPPRYVINFLKILETTIELEKATLPVPRFITARNVLTVTRGPDTGWPLPRDVAELQDFFKPFISEKLSIRKIYISRLHSTRSPKFEAELIHYLSENNWEILYLEKMDLEMQIRAFSEASVVCGVHGAGLAGIVWMRENSQVIELVPDRYVPCFGRLSTVMRTLHNVIEYSDLESNAIGIFHKISDKVL